MNLQKISKLAIALAFVASSSFADYKSKSEFSDNYRCVAHESGGYNHTKEGHVLTRFNGKPEFFITHISRIPTAALKQMKSKEIVQSLNGDMDALKELVEASYMKREEIYDNNYVEKGSYFIRDPDQDPNLFSTYFAANCEAYGGSEFEQIVCNRFGGTEKFDFDVKSGRFVYSRAGSWHSNRREGYSGDSSEFAFGICEKYFN